jgi:hypothetical protein
MSKPGIAPRQKSSNRRKRRLVPIRNDITGWEQQRRLTGEMLETRRADPIPGRRRAARRRPSARGSVTGDDEHRLEIDDIYTNLYGRTENREHHNPAAESDMKSVDGSNRICAVVIPSTARPVRFVHANPHKRSTRTALNVMVEVKNSVGTVLATALPATAIGYGPEDGSVSNRKVNRDDPQTPGGEFHQSSRIKATLTPQQSLSAGRSYYVEFSAPSGADVRFNVVAGGSERCRRPRGEIHGQSLINGRSWTNVLDHGAASKSAMHSYSCRSAEPLHAGQSGLLWSVRAWRHDPRS